MRAIQKYKTTFFCLLLATAACAQPAQFSFRHLTTNDGLSDGVVEAIAQDKYGFMWFGTVNGLNIYNGYTVTVLQHVAGQATSLHENRVSALCRDAAGTMWLAQPSGLYHYDYTTGHFLAQPGTGDWSIRKMIAVETVLYLATKNGLKAFDVAQQKFVPLAAASDTETCVLLQQRVLDFCVSNGNEIYITTDTGLVHYNRLQQKATVLSPKTKQAWGFKKVAVDKQGMLWLSFDSTGASLLLTDKQFLQSTVYTTFGSAHKKALDNRINAVYTDAAGRVWLATSRNGLCLYNSQTTGFETFENDPLQPQSIAANLVTAIHPGSDGALWLGSEGYGVAYFYPDRNIFHALLPSLKQTPTLPDNWCRAAAEDASGRWWLGTANGAALYNPQTNTYEVFQNTDAQPKKLWYNSVRSLLCASDGTVWIGTANGLNRYHPGTKKMDFFGKQDGLPLSFFWSLVEDEKGLVWIGCRDGIYYYDGVLKKFNDCSSHTALKPWCRTRVRTLFQDSRKRLWFGFDGAGLLLYDKESGHTRYWAKQGDDTTTLTENHIIAITEDQSGVIWISTAGGADAYDERKNTFTHYNQSGLQSLRTSGLLADGKNRLWIGTVKGLYLLDAGRNYLKAFGLPDGLASTDFNDQAAFKTRNGTFVFPTLKGFLYFNPELYTDEQAEPRPYLTAFRVFNKDYGLLKNLEAVDTIRLKWDQNFFSAQLAAPRFQNTDQVWYAWKLEPFDHDWVYTKERWRNYTNVSGGHYVLHYKATTNPANWAVPEQRIAISVGTVFYKTGWFIVLATVLLLYTGYGLYKYRLRQHQKIAALQNKATTLEKEKVLVLYESLKQQLNPHFLFNSLSSLSGLIQKDQAAAKTFLDRLSKIYRYILQSRDSELVSIAEDLKLAETYVQLQQTRFGSGLQVVFDIPQHLQSKKIAPVTLQNALQNAIKHNVIDGEQPLKIEVTTEEDFVVVRNNLQKKAFVETSNKQGLKNLQTLYRYLSGRQIVIDEDDHFFTLKIPYV